MIFISAKYCHKSDCYLRDGTSIDKLYNATVTRCASLGFKLSKITSREEHLFVMKVMRVSTQDSSVPSMFTGIFILTSIICNQELFLLCFRVIHSEENYFCVTSVISVATAGIKPRTFKCHCICVISIWLLNCTFPPKN